MIAADTQTLERAAAIRNELLKAEARPPRSEVNAAGIPKELKAERRWVCWAWKRGRNKWTKAPVKCDRSPASSTDSDTWTSFGEAMTAYQTNPLIAGIGFVLGDGWAGVDLDSCYDPASDKADPIIHDVVSKIESYTELSPSQTGVKILARGTLPDGRRQSRADASYDVECYDHGRFFTITGQRWDGSPAEVNHAGLELSWFHQTYVDDRSSGQANEGSRIDSSFFAATNYPASDDLTRVREALENIPGHYADGYEDWLRVGMGAKAAAGDEAFDDWVDWSAQSPKFGGADECRAKWDSFSGTFNGVGMGTLVQMAKQSGWSPSWAGQNGSPFGSQNGLRRQNPSGNDSPVLDPPIEPVGIAELIDKCPELRPPVIEGLLRQGETANFIAAAKTGKSFLAGGLAWSVASGTPWLGHEVTQGAVAIIDNELHRETLSSRLYRIATDMMVDYRDYKGSIDVFSLRGVGVDIHNLEHRLASIEAGKYRLVVLDALYRTLPDGTSENDNAAMMAIYNRLDYYATKWDCSIVVVHHASKGDQSGKAVTDVGAGAGSISRAADTHLTIRPHEDEGLSVLECVTRSFKSPAPKSLSFDWPLWREVSAKPVLKTPKSGADAKQEAQDAKSEKAVRSALEAAGDWLAPSAIRRKVGFGQTRVDRALVRLGDQLERKTMENPRNRKEEIDVYRIAQK